MSPKADSEKTIDEIREERDRYHAVLVKLMQNEWKNATIEDWSTDGKAEQRVQEILAELEA